MKNKAVIFDLGGTLIKSLSLGEAYSKLRSLHLVPGLNTSEAVVKQAAKIYFFLRKQDTTEFKEINLAGILENVFVNKYGKRNAYDLVAKIYRYMTENKIFPETLAVLKQLKLFGYRVGIISNSVFPMRYHAPFLIESGIYNYADEILFSADFGYKKPSKFIYREMFKRLEVRSYNAFFIGNNLKCDVAGPKSVGMKAILIDRGLGQYRANGFDRIKNLREIFYYL